MIVRRATIDDAADIAWCNMRGWQVGYRGIMPDDFLDSLDHSQRTENWRKNLSDDGDSKYTLVAQLNGKAVGFATIGPSRDGMNGYDSELWAIYVDPDHWGQGIGRALFDRVTRDLKSRGIESTYVWCLRDNHKGRKFYEAIGGMYLEGISKKFILNEEPYEEVAYGWRDL